MKQYKEIMVQGLKDESIVKRLENVLKLIDKIKADFYILESGERVHPITMWHRHGTRKWAFLQRQYPNIKKADGFQLKYLFKL